MHAPLDASGISLRQFFPQGRLITPGLSAAASDVWVETLCSDSRRVRSGDLFVALPGAASDGHDYVVDAIENGAAAVLTERLLPVSIPQCIVPDTRLAHSQLCLELAGRPERQLRVTGVAGTAGKTVASLLMASILKAAGRRVGLTSSIGYCDSEDLAPARETTPNSPQVATWLSRMAENGCRDVVMEMAGEALADRRASAVPLHTAVLTNLDAPARELDGGVSYDAYCRQTSRLFQQLESDGVVVLNTDDPRSCQLLPQIDHGVLTVGIHSDADVTAKILERNRGDQLFLLRAGAESAPVRTRMLGDFHVQNCLLATAVGLRLGISLDHIIQGIETLDRVPGRLDRVVAGQSCGVFLDASQETSTLAHNLRALQQVTPGKVVCVFGAHPAEDESICAARGRVVETGADGAMITGHSLERKASLQTMHDILDGYEDPAAAHLMPCRANAIQWAVSHASPDDTVFIAGAAAHERDWVEQLIRSEEVVATPALPSQNREGSRRPQSTKQGPLIYRIEDYR